MSLLGAGQPFLPRANEVWGRVMFLHLCVILFTGGEGVWLPNMHYLSHDQGGLYPGGYIRGILHPGGLHPGLSASGEGEGELGRPAPR